MQLPALFSGFWKRSLIALALAGLMLAGLGTWLSSTLSVLEERSTDWIWRQTASQQTERRVIIIDIDEASLAQYGPWPWPRERIAQLSDRLRDEGSALQVYDLVFADSKEGDETLAATLARNQATISQVFAIHGGQVQQGQLSGAMPWAHCPSVFAATNDYLGNTATFSHLPTGHITPALAADGSVRAQPAFICHHDQAYPALFLAAAMHASHSLDQVQLQPGKGLLAPAWQLTSIPFAEQGVAINARGNVRVPWAVHPQAFVSISARDVLEQRVPAGLLTNAWAVVGSTALGLNDRIATPFNNPGSGVLVHAQFLVGLLDGNIPREPRFNLVWGMALGLLGAVALCVLARRQRKHRSFSLLLGALAGSGLLFGLKAVLLTQAALWLAWVPPALFLLISALNLSALEYAWSRHERDRIYSHLASYLPRPVAAALALRDPSDVIEANRSSIVALYADIRNFSAYCEQRPPEESAAVLHAFIAVATEIVEQHGGIIESIQGDAILAVWQTPVHAPTAAADMNRLASSALAASLALLDRAGEFLPQLHDDPVLQPLALGVGLESGHATVGSFGPARRRTHLALGHPVTLAIRLEKMTTELAHPLLAGENLVAALGEDHPFESQGVFLLDGMLNPCRIYAYPLQRRVPQAD
ncbi:MAG: adenylate/guanylate cyclase domain-containing protein [Brachymonas sp.]|nr:adenylate/guanylate cyclase domain-containing protein [Brachymonas sp.]